ncbi:MAG: PmoA family protein [Vicinamibacterales bacterium]
MTRLTIVAVLLSPVVLMPAADAPRIQVIPNDTARRVDVIADGKPFTSYIYPTSQKKPVLYPLRTAKGTLVTRGWPLEPRRGERIDHPHQVGLWLNYGDVSGLDFWGHSDATPADQAPKMGTIVHRKVIEARSGADRGDLAVETDWVGHDGRAVLREQTQFTFRGTADTRSVDRITTLTAVDRRVVFRDTKEGMFGLRVARALEQPADKPEVFTDAAGRPENVPVLDNAGVTGQYLSSDGLKGDAVWGTRARWVLLSGTVESEPVTLVMLDHPDNPGFPTYWHARGYGLFAANPLGQKDFTQGKQELNLAIEPGRSITFRYRVLILGAATPESIEREYRAFTSSPSS